MCCFARPVVDRNAESNILSLDADSGFNSFVSIQATSSGTAWRVRWCNNAGAVNDTATIQDVVNLLNKWFFVAVTRNGTAVAGYVRQVTPWGTMKRQTVTGTGTMNAHTRFRVGRNSETGFFFNGRVAGVKLWDVTLTPAEVLRESYQLAPVSRRNRINLWVPYDTGVDYSGRSRNLSNAAGPAKEAGPPIPLYASNPGFVRKAAAQGAAQFELNIESGSYSISGSPATLLFDRVINAEPGAYVLTGSPATLTRGFAINAEAGGYSITGAEATLLADRVVDAQAGSYSLTGAAATLAADRLFNAEPGAYSLTGSPASLLKELILSAEAGSYSITGAAATLFADRVLDAQPGVYGLTGSPATLLGDRFLSLDTGTYTITGFAAELEYTPVGGTEFILVAESGSYLLAGSSLRGVLEFDQFPGGDGDSTIFILNE